MNTTQQPEALALAQEYRVTMPESVLHLWAADAMDTMRRQHARIENLEAQLSTTDPTQQGMDARDAAFEAVRKDFCKLQRYSFFLDGAGNVRRCADHCGNWVEFDTVHTLFEPQSVDAAIAAQAKNGGAA